MACVWVAVAADVMGVGWFGSVWFWSVVTTINGDGGMGMLWVNDGLCCMANARIRLAATWEYGSGCGGNFTGLENWTMMSM